MCDSFDMDEKARELHESIANQWVNSLFPELRYVFSLKNGRKKCKWENRQKLYALGKTIKDGSVDESKNPCAFSQGIIFRNVG